MAKPRKKKALPESTPPLAAPPYHPRLQRLLKACPNLLVLQDGVINYCGRELPKLVLYCTQCRTFVRWRNTSTETADLHFYDTGEPQAPLFHQGKPGIADSDGDQIVCGCADADCGIDPDTEMESYY